MLCYVIGLRSRSVERCDRFVVLPTIQNGHLAVVGTSGVQRLLDARGQNWPLRCPPGWMGSGCPGPSHRPHPLCTPLVGTSWNRTYRRTSLREFRVLSLPVICLWLKIRTDYSQFNRSGLCYAITWHCI